MLFNSLAFLIFLPITLILYYALPFKYRWLLIFIASCVFYMAAIPSYILILFLVIAVDYVSAIGMENKTGLSRKLWLLFSLISNLMLLSFFKYFGFINQNLEHISHWLGIGFTPKNLEIILPIGLSFHTFQSMSYTIEVYRGRQKAERHLGHFANYVLFFPQMVAGPIERYETLGRQLKEEHQPAYENFSSGFRLVLQGLLMKMCVADNLAPLVNQVYQDPASYPASQVWLAVFLFSLQIYADFSGYSTIALGCARLLGISIMDNFKTPYFSKSIGEFWTRWHISLSSWFRDYLYIPLGGSRVNLARLSFNLLLVFMVSGLWHGASWTFVAWGACHGLLRLFEILFNKLSGFKLKEGWGPLNIFLAAKTFFLVSLFWIFFRAENFQKAQSVFKALLGITAPRINEGTFTPQASLNFGFYPVWLFVLVLFVMDLMIYNSRIDIRLSGLKTPVRWIAYTLMLFCLLALAGTQKLSFIYFQF